MNRLFLLLLTLAAVACGSDSSSPDPNTPNAPDSDGSPDAISQRTLVSGLDTPWDIQIATDGALWVTERRGVVSRVDTSTGALERVATLSDVVEISESGLLGMALHPDFDTRPLVYLAYSYSGSGQIRNRLSHMRWDGTALSSEEILLDDIPGANNHNGSRLAFGPDGQLYMTTGDALVTTLSQDTSSLAGKVLRVTEEGRPSTGNPFGNEIYSIGHRNAQGLVFHPTSGDLYVTEHGPSTNDEVSRIISGGNYGWPNVHGFCDNDVPGLNETDFCAANNVIEPLAAWTPTVAPAGLDYYDGGMFPEWKGSLLFVALRGATLLRLPLNRDGSAVTGQERLFEDTFGRMRDVLVGPRGEVYLAISNRDGRGRPASDDDRIIVLSR